MLIVAAQILAAPGWPFEHHADEFDRHMRGEERFHERDFPRMHHEYRGHDRLYRMDFLSERAARAGLETPRFLGTRIGPAPVPMTIQPPVQFSYYCNDPPGYFPDVTSCAGQWLESGSPPIQ